MNDGANTTSSQITTYANTLTPTIANYRAQASTFFTEKLASYDSYRKYATYGLSGAVIAVVIALSITMINHSPTMVKGCNLCANPIYLLIQFLAIIVFFLALIVGDLCTSIFETSPPTLASLNGYSALTTVRKAISL